MRNNLKDSKN